MSRIGMAIVLIAGIVVAPRVVGADDLIDRFARLEAIGGVSIATDGRHIALLCERNGRRAACVHELDAVDKPPQIFAPRLEQRRRLLHHQ